MDPKRDFPPPNLPKLVAESQAPRLHLDKNISESDLHICK